MPEFKDNIKFKSKRITTDEGYLQVHARISRIGIQNYRAIELDITDRDPNEIIKVHRPPEEVFHKDSLNSFRGKPCTNDHPPKSVKPTNYKKYSVGHAIGDVTHDDEFVETDLLFVDQEAIGIIGRGKVEISNGYTADIKIESGVTDEGEEYDAIQHNIRGNHIALVNRGRAGPKVKLSDKGNKTVKVTINDVGYEIPDGPAAEAVQNMASANTKLKDDLEEAKKEAGKKDSKIKELEKKVDDKPDNDKLVADQVAFIATVKTIDKEYDVTGKTNDQVKRDLLKSERDMIIADDADAAYVEGAWASLVTEAGKNGNSTKKIDDALGDLFKTGHEVKDDDGKIIDRRPADVIAREEMIKRNQSASNTAA